MCKLAHKNDNHSHDIEPDCAIVGHSGHGQWMSFKCYSNIICQHKYLIRGNRFKSTLTQIQYKVTFLEQ